MSGETGVPGKFCTRSNETNFIDPTGMMMEISCYTDPDSYFNTGTDTGADSSVGVQAGAQHCQFWDDGRGYPKDQLSQVPTKTLKNLPQRAIPLDCAGYHYTDPIMGALEVKLKVGPEVQIGPLKAGISAYKNVTTGQTGTKGEVGLGLFSAEADNPTPEGGNFMQGGGPKNIEYSASVLGFQMNFATGHFSFDPSKSLSFGGQLLFGAEVSYNSDKAFDIYSKNIRCGVDN